MTGRYFLISLGFIVAALLLEYSGKCCYIHGQVELRSGRGGPAEQLAELEADARMLNHEGDKFVIAGIVCAILFLIFSAVSMLKREKARRWIALVPLVLYILLYFAAV
ncbi:MAG: hypothetical protein IH624_02635 [Phycisphaerae bacterium]|nr:hypothetical protein [Phycisphaerae bacterium]